MRPNVTAAGRLRLASRIGRMRMQDHLHASGFEDVTMGHITVFRFEGPEGRQPTEIATQAGLSKQAVNDTLRHLEDRGYLTRVPHPQDGRARVVHLTDHGRALQRAVAAAGRRVEADWREEIGEAEWRVFSRVLDRLAGPELLVRPPD